MAPVLPVAAIPLVGGARRRSGLAYLLLLPGMLWLAIFFVIPFGSLFATSLQDSAAGPFGNYASAISQYWGAYVRALSYAGISTLLALIIAYPLAYYIALRSGRWRGVLLVLVIAPSFASFLLRTYAWRTILADEGPVTSFFNALGVLPDDRILSTGIAVVAGLTYNFLPFMILPLYASLDRIDPRLIEAAGDLYASGSKTFWKVTWPLSMPGVIAGTLLTFIPASGDFINAQLLGSPQTQMIGNAIQANFYKLRDYPMASSLSFILMATIVILVVAYIRRAGTEEIV